VIDLIIKVGGGLLQDRDDLDRTLAAVTHMARARRALLVPGGGPFADAVREIDRRVGIGDDAAHWMAVLAMDQYAHFLAARLPEARLVTTPEQAAAALDAARLPVLAPFDWLKRADPLPHGWHVTSDSIAAWLAGEVGARELVLFKPAGAVGPLVDDYFERALPATVKVTIVAADHVMRP
jgi:aspartokinase-like uncharacterized kinase